MGRSSPQLSNNNEKERLERCELKTKHRRTGKGKRSQARKQRHRKDLKSTPLKLLSHLPKQFVGKERNLKRGSSMQKTLLGKGEVEGGSVFGGLLNLLGARGLLTEKTRVGCNITLASRDS